MEALTHKQLTVFYEEMRDSEQTVKDTSRSSDKNKQTVHYEVLTDNAQIFQDSR